MKTKLTACLCILLGMFTIAAAAAIGDAPVEEAPDFSKFPITATFARIVERHRKGEDQWKGHSEPLLLLMSHFVDGGGNWAYQHVVTASARWISYREVGEFWVNQGRTSEISPDQIRQLEGAISALPQTNIYPPFSDFVIVSFWDREKWVTHTYAAKDVAAIYGSIGARYEKLYRR